MRNIVSVNTSVCISPFTNKRSDLEGDGCKDCLCACCCSPCDLVQQDKEAAYREGNTTTHQQPPKMDNMAYKPQPAQGPPQPGQYAPQQGQYPQQPGQYAQQQYPQGQYTHQQY